MSNTYHLPWKQAVRASAIQNFDRDLRDDPDWKGVWAREWRLYYREAITVLQREGNRNYDPDFDDHAFIFVKGPVP